MRGDVIIRALAIGIVGTLLFAILPTAGEAQSRIPRLVIASGGPHATGGGVSLQGTVGQPVAGTAKVATHAGFFGFWYNEGNSVVSVHPTPLAQAASPVITSLYPNPANGTVTADIHTDPARNITVLLVDLLGRAWSRHEAFVGANGVATLTLPLQGLPPGMYYMTITGSAAIRGFVVR